MEEYGSLEREVTTSVRKEKEDIKTTVEQAPAKKLMQEEERNTGAVTWGTYRRYLQYAGGIIWAPVIISLLVVSQAAQGMHEYSADTHVLNTVIQSATTYFLAFGPRTGSLASAKVNTSRFTLV